VVVIIGCAAPPKKPPVREAPPVVKDPFSVFPERYRSKAMEYESQGELRKALQSWEIVRSFVPQDGEALKKVAVIKTKIQTLADEHFKKGLSYYQNNSIQAARKEFLLALTYNPNHEEALDYVKNKMMGENYTLYEVKKGDTLKTVAKKIYNDPQKDFLIAYFNQLERDAKLAPKTTLKLPLLEPTPTKPSVDVKEMPMEEKEIPIDTKEILSKAMVSFKAREYPEAASMTEKILEYDPENKEARDLINASYFNIGTMLIQERKFQEALEVLKRVDPSYKDAKESIAYAKKSLAEAHYTRGIKYYTDEELEKAIKEWEATLTLDPHHPKAKGDIENARHLLQKLKKLK
jgi:tetratricopeptide (TPR) repeat protein